MRYDGLQGFFGDYFVESINTILNDDGDLELDLSTLDLDKTKNPGEVVCEEVYNGGVERYYDFR